MHLSQITPPHQPNDADKLAALVAAYDADKTVSPFVVVDFGAACVALSGSHRIAAAKDVFEDDTDVEESGLGVVVDGNDLYESAAQDADAIEALDRLQSDRVGRFADVIEALWAHLPVDAQAALQDQRS